MKYNHLQQDSRLAILVRSLGGKCTEWHRGSRSPFYGSPRMVPFLVPFFVDRLFSGSPKVLQSKFLNMMSLV